MAAILPTAMPSPCRILAVAGFFLLGLARAGAQDGVPVSITEMPPVTAPVSRENTKIDLRPFFGITGVTGNLVQVDTNRGTMTWELYANATLTVENFLNYLRTGRYDNTIIHRSVDNPGVIQGGGYYRDPLFAEVARDAPIANDYDASRPNDIGTVAMAKMSGDPNSATSEWFVNVADNSLILDEFNNGGFTVFARVIGTGTTVAGDIGNLTTVAAGGFMNVPITSGSTPTSSNVVFLESIKESAVYPNGTDTPAHLSFTASTANGSLVTPTIRNSRLILSWPSSAAGNTTVTVVARDVNGNAASSTFVVTLTKGASLNNSFAQAVTLDGSADTETDRSIGATKEGGEPNHAGNAGGASLWYRWTAPSDAVVSLSTDGTNFDTLLGVYTGNAVNSLTQIVANDNHGGRVTSEVTFRPTTGTTYRIAVDGKDGASGRVNISLRSATAGTPVAGRYVGIVAGDETIHALNGYLDLQLNSGGGFSAQMVIGRRTLRFSGGFGSDGVYFRNFGGSDDLELQLVLGTASITGDIWSGDYGGTVNADWSAPGVAGGFTAAPGRYTLAFDIPPQPAVDDERFGFLNLPLIPEGFGIASALVRTDGSVYFSGQLADGEAFTASGPLSSQNRVALGVRLREGRELVAGFISFSGSGNTSTASGNVGWTKTFIGGDRFFEEGFAESIGVSGGFYEAPGWGELVIGLPRTPDNAQFNVEGGNLRREVDPVIGTLRRDNSFREFDGVSIELDRSTGYLEGRFYDPGAYATRSWQAIALRQSDEILGWFSGERGMGSITITGVTESTGNGTDSGNGPDIGIGGF